MIANLIYGLCALLSLATAVMLLRHQRREPNRLVFWTACCFSGLAISNLVLILDKFALTAVDLEISRHSIALASLLVLLFGLINEDD
jgi:hypothetical protein